PRPRSAGAGGGRREEARLRREAAGALAQRGARDRRGTAARRLHAHGRAPDGLPPGLLEAPGAGALGRARARAVPLRAAGQPRTPAPRRERAVVVRPARPLDDPFTGTVPRGVGRGA